MRHVIIFVLAAAALAASAPASRAATYYLDAAKGDDANPGTSTDSPWKTFEKANAALMPGDACLVRAGVYGQSQIAPVRSGTADARITYAACEAETPEVTGGKFGAVVFLQDKSYVTVKGFKIHSPAEHDWLVTISGEKAQYNRIDNCEVYDPQGYTLIVIARGASYNAVTGCTLHDTGGGNEGSGDCVVLNYEAHHNTISGNKCYNGCHSQIMLLNGSKDNVVADNDLYSTDSKWAGAGVGLPLGADSNVIMNNRIHDLGRITDQKCGIQVDSASNSIHHNVIYNVGAFGISLQSYAYGGKAQAAQDNLVANNTVYGAGRQGLFVVSKGECVSTNNAVANNIVVGSPADWYGKNAWIMVFDTYHFKEAAAPGTWFGNTFTNNLFFHEKPDEPDMVLYNFKTGTKSWSLSDLQKEFPASFSGNIVADPGFVDPAKGEFALKPGSPAIDAGVKVGLPFESKAPDIGAVETKAAK